jgi:hypothetical protein
MYQILQPCRCASIIKLVFTYFASEQASDEICSQNLGGGGTGHSAYLAQVPYSLLVHPFCHQQWVIMNIF